MQLSQTNYWKNVALLELLQQFHMVLFNWPTCCCKSRLKVYDRNRLISSTILRNALQGMQVSKKDIRGFPKIKIDVSNWRLSIFIFISSKVSCVMSHSISLSIPNLFLLRIFLSKNSIMLKRKSTTVTATAQKQNAKQFGS